MIATGSTLDNAFQFKEDITFLSMICSSLVVEFSHPFSKAGL